MTVSTIHRTLEKVASRVEETAAGRWRFGIGDDRCEEIDIILALGPLDLIGPFEGVVDPAHHRWHGSDGIERLIWIHGLAGITICGHLPT